MTSAVVIMRPATASRATARGPKGVSDRVRMIIPPGVPATEPEVSPYDLGISLSGSTKGRGTTLAARSPSGVVALRRVPSSADAVGNIA